MYATDSYLIKQLFDERSSSFTYLLACQKTRYALIIDSVHDQMDVYHRLIKDYQLHLLYALETHIHADHISGMHLLKQTYHCQLLMGAHTKAIGLDRLLADNEEIKLGEISLKTLHTPGHTSESCSYLLANNIFTGDALLIHGTGRTDFQNGCAGTSYESLFNKLLTFPEDFRVFPGHDYNGRTSTTIGEEIRLNPRLQVASKEEYIAIMDNLNLTPPKAMHIAVPANLRCGAVEAEIIKPFA